MRMGRCVMLLLMLASFALHALALNACVGNQATDPIYVDKTNVTTGQVRVGASIFLQDFAGDDGDFDVGSFKSSLKTGLETTTPPYFTVECGEIHIETVTLNLNDGVTWGTDVAFWINTTLNRAEELRKALNQSFYGSFSNSFGGVFPSSPIVSEGTTPDIDYSDNDKVNCVHEGYTGCDYCASSSRQTLTLKLISPAVNGGSCPPLTKSVYCDGRCLKDWQIGLISLACFLFLVLICIILYCCCFRKRTPKQDKQLDGAAVPPPVTSADKGKSSLDDDNNNLEKAIDEPATNIEKPLELEIVDPQPNTNTKPQDSPKGFSTVPDDDDTNTAPVVAAPTTESGAPPKANIVRVHL